MLKILVFPLPRTPLAIHLYLRRDGPEICERGGGGLPVSFRSFSPLPSPVLSLPSALEVGPVKPAMGFGAAL